MKYKYTRKEIAGFINDNHGWHIHDEAIRMVLAKAEPKKECWECEVNRKKGFLPKCECDCHKPHGVAEYYRCSCDCTPELPEIERFSAFEIEDMEDGVDEAIARKINELVERVNQLRK